MQMLVYLMLSQESLRLSSFFCFIFFFPYSICAAVMFTILSQAHLSVFFASVILLLIPFSLFFISVIVLFISVCSLCFFSRSLLVISYFFLICTSIFFLRSRIIFAIITLNSFSCRFPVFTSRSCFSCVLSLPFTGEYSPSVLFCLTFCDCGLCPTDCRVVTLFTPAVSSGASCG